MVAELPSIISRVYITSLLGEIMFLPLYTYDNKRLKYFKKCNVRTHLLLTSIPVGCSLNYQAYLVGQICP